MKVSDLERAVICTTEDPKLSNQRHRVKDYAVNFSNSSARM